MAETIRPKKRVLLAFLAAPIILYFFAVFVPLITAAYYSLFEWKGGPNKTFIGFENYLTLFKDTLFWDALSNNIFLVVACIIGQIGIAFVTVLLINSTLAKFKGIHRTFGFFPSTISAVYIGFIWMMIYDYKRGLLNLFLEWIGRADLQKVWLNEPSLVMFLIAIPLIWQYIGYYMVILLSAITSVDKEIFEAADIDGASSFQRAIHILLPLIKNTVLVCITLCIAGNMKAFDHIYVMTAGGPGNSSMVMALYGYKVSFDQGNMGYGSAISIGIFCISLIIIGGTNFILRKLSKGGDI